MLPSVRGIPSGSSPLTRGALGPGIPGSLGPGIIPAYAGSTPERSSPATALRDHPRLRGEHISRERHENSREGSSPLTRGALSLQTAMSWTARIIPAYAGSTFVCGIAYFVSEDHPRLRGEHKAMPLLFTRMTGSSPLTRGARTRPSLLFPSPGIIPAYAGSTAEHGKQRDSRRDHPRLRGEHYVMSSSISRTPGSSPLTRGALTAGRSTSDSPGIIPAYAGSTHLYFARIGFNADHPRLRGEHLASARANLIVLGSSPLTRGALASRKRRFGCGRIIPAYAGSTDRHMVDVRAVRDHPRLRGEHAFLVSPCNAGRGSSPLTRGALPAKQA